jgi:hypothetical protein
MMLPNWPNCYHYKMERRNGSIDVIAPAEYNLPSRFPPAPNATPGYPMNVPTMVVFAPNQPVPTTTKKTLSDEAPFQPHSQPPK